MQRRKFEFVGVVEEVRFHRMHTAVFLPHHIFTELPKGRHKVSGLMNGVPFSITIQNRKDKGWFLSVNARLRCIANIEPGDPVKVSFHILDNTRVEVPEIFETVPGAEDLKLKRFRAVEQRNLIQYLEAAKNADTRLRKFVETVQRSKVGEVKPDELSRKKKKNRRRSR